MKKTTWSLRKENEIEQASTIEQINTIIGNMLFMRVNMINCNQREHSNIKEAFGKAITRGIELVKSSNEADDVKDRLKEWADFGTRFFLAEEFIMSKLAQYVAAVHMPSGEVVQFKSERGV